MHNGEVEAEVCLRLLQHAAKGGDLSGEGASSLSGRASLGNPSWTDSSTPPDTVQDAG